MEPSKLTHLVNLWRPLGHSEEALIETISKTSLKHLIQRGSTPEHRIHLEMLYFNAVHFLRYGFYQ